MVPSMHIHCEHAGLVTRKFEKACEEENIASRIKHQLENKREKRCREKEGGEMWRKKR